MTTNFPSSTPPPSPELPKNLDIALKQRERRRSSADQGGKTSEVAKEKLKPSEELSTPTRTRSDSSSSDETSQSPIRIIIDSPRSQSPSSPATSEADSKSRRFSSASSEASSASPKTSPRKSNAVQLSNAEMGELVEELSQFQVDMSQAGFMPEDQYCEYMQVQTTNLRDRETPFVGSVATFIKPNNVQEPKWNSSAILNFSFNGKIKEMSNIDTIGGKDQTIDYDSFKESITYLDLIDKLHDDFSISYRFEPGKELSLDGNGAKLFLKAASHPNNIGAMNYESALNLAKNSSLPFVIYFDPSEGLNQHCVLVGNPKKLGTFDTLEWDPEKLDIYKKQGEEYHKKLEKRREIEASFAEAYTTKKPRSIGKVILTASEAKEAMSLPFIKCAYDYEDNIYTPSKVETNLQTDKTYSLYFIDDKNILLMGPTRADQPANLALRFDDREKIRYIELTKDDDATKIAFLTSLRKWNEIGKVSENLNIQLYSEPHTDPKVLKFKSGKEAIEHFEADIKKSRS